MFTRPNKTKICTTADIIMTPLPLAQQVVNHYKPTGKCLEPARGTGNIYRYLPDGSDWCEISEGKDFFDYHDVVDWIITNPPYSIYDKFIFHCFDISDNVVVLVPLQKAFKSMTMINRVKQYGGLKEVWVLGSGGRCGFAFGFPCGCLYYKRDWKGDITLTLS